MGLAEWTRNKKPISYTWVKVSQDIYDFDIKKANKIFDLLLQQGQIQLSPNYRIPSAEELKRKKYCHWYNSISHDTNDCKVFRQKIQSAIEQGRIKFEEVKKPMKIDGHPFPAGTNMVEISLAKGKAKVLTSARAKEFGAIDPEVQLLANEFEAVRRHRAKQRSRCEQGKNSKSGAKIVHVLHLKCY